MSGHTLFDQATLQSFRFTEPADKVSGERYVYVVAFASGLLKVGYTARPHARMTSHIGVARTHGTAAISAWISGPHANATENEKELISYCRDTGMPQGGAEYFSDVDFGDIVKFAESLTFERLDTTTPKVRRRMRREASDAAWGERIRTGQAVVLLPHEHDRLSELALRTRETSDALERVLGMQRIFPQYLPDALRRAADRLEKHPWLLAEWERILPDLICGVETPPINAGPVPEAVPGATTP